MPLEFKADGAWVQAVKALAMQGVSDPGLLVYVLMNWPIESSTGRFDLGGGYPRALATIAEALGTKTESVQDAYLARSARRSDAARLIADALDAVPAMRSALPAARVGDRPAMYGADPGQLVDFARHLAKSGGAALPAPRTSPEWRNILGALRVEGNADPSLLAVLAQFRRVHLASGEVAEPLEEDDAFLTVADALEKNFEAVRDEVRRALGAASLVSGPNYARAAVELEPVVARLPGIARVERVPAEGAVVAKRTIDGGLPEGPWRAFPEDPTSMRWRMGPGEDAMDRWHTYWASLSAEERALYLDEQPPPPAWRAWLEAATPPDSPSQPRAIHFYRVNGPFGFLSNFARAPIMLDGRRWPTSEHYFQAQKFTGADERERVRATASPMEAARLGRSLGGLRPDWDQVRDEVMLNALRAKFSQHPYLCSELLATDDATLVEHTENDDYWADGGDGSGRNRLGVLLMQVRAEMRQRP